MDEPRDPIVSVVIPAFNEEEGIEGVVRQIQSLPGPIEMIVVDDGSTDRTAERAIAAGARVMRHRATADTEPP